ncbi:MAG: hypothetical protein M1607_03000 [Patescibacteria group bacterium]|nr:hypothetical protein [Patescibacteria group bacterium]
MEEIEPAEIAQEVRKMAAEVLQKRSMPHGLLAAIFPEYERRHRLKAYQELISNQYPRLARRLFIAESLESIEAHFQIATQVGVKSQDLQTTFSITAQYFMLLADLLDVQKLYTPGLVDQYHRLRHIHRSVIGDSADPSNSLSA